MSSLLSPEQFDAALGIAGWKADTSGAIARFATGSFDGGVQFVVRIGAIAQAANHHPDVDLRYLTVTVHTVTHDAGGLTARDVELARAISAAAADLGIAVAADPS